LEVSTKILCASKQICASGRSVAFSFVVVFWFVVCLLTFVEYIPRKTEQLLFIDFFCIEYDGSLYSLVELQPFQ